MKLLLILSLIFSATLYSVARADFDDATCDNVCTMLVDQSNDKTVGITGKDSWTSSDDAWCAANPYSSSTPITDSAVATNENRCQYHNTQVLTYCIAYEKIQAAKGMEMPLLLLDVAGAALCGTACFATLAPGAGQAVFAACRIDSTAASAFDIYDAIALQSDPTARALTGLTGTAGIGINLIGAADAAKNGAASKTEFLTGKGGDHDKRNACITAGILAAGAGMRAFDIAHQQQSKQSACSDVKSLLSNSPVIGVINTTTPALATSGSSSQGSTQSNARSGTSITGSSSGSVADQVKCAENGLSSCNFANQGQFAAATDGGLLASSGLDKTLAQQLAKTDLSGVSQTAPDAAAMIASALGSDSGDIGTKIAEVAKAAQKDGETLAKSNGSYSGASAVAAAPKNAAGFGGFNFDSPDTAAKKDELKFDRAPASIVEGDIWHTDFKGSIFQIVSSKIVESKPKVDNLDWSTPLNRALMGLPSQKESALGGSGGLK